MHLLRSQIFISSKQLVEKEEFILTKIYLPNFMGSFRSEPQLTKTTYQMSSLDHSYASVHMCGWRRYMEDASVTISPFTYKNYSLFAVFDGHGGPEVALYAQKKFPEELQRSANLRKGKFQQALRETFLKMDTLLMSEKGRREIEELRKQQIAKKNTNQGGSLTRVGCTSLVVLVTKQNIYVANAGDCRAVAFTYKGECTALSKDHKPHDPLQQNRIKNAGGYIQYGRVNGCLNLTRAFGDLQFKQNKNLSLQQQMITSYPQITKFPRKGLHFIIMGCDGIWQSKSSQQMTSWIKKRLVQRVSLGKILQNLLDQLVAKDSNSETGTDNMSAILVKFDKTQ